MQIYADRLKDGWSMVELDCMDFIGYLRVLAHQAKKKEREIFIDDIL